VPILREHPETQDSQHSPCLRRRKHSPTFVMESAFARPIATVLANFGVDENDGLTTKQVEQLRNKHGRNGAQPRPPIKNPASVSHFSRGC